MLPSISWLLAVMVAGAFAFIAADFVPPTLDDSTVVTIERGPCSWQCPQYTAVLYGSGRVEFEGRHYVCAKGRHTAVVDPFAVRNLVARLVEGGYFDLSWAEGSVTSDRDTVTTSLRHGGRTRLILHHHGDVRAPRVLKEWEEQIDEAARSSRWLPERKRQRPVCRRAHGSVETVKE